MARYSNLRAGKREGEDLLRLKYELEKKGSLKGLKLNGLMRRNVRIGYQDILQDRVHTICVSICMCSVFVSRHTPWPALKSGHSKQSHHALQDVIKVKVTVLPISIGSFRLPHITVLIHDVGTPTNTIRHIYSHFLFSSSSLAIRGKTASLGAESISYLQSA